MILNIMDLDQTKKRSLIRVYYFQHDDKFVKKITLMIISIDFKMFLMLRLITINEDVKGTALLLLTF